ncbi:4-sulfomuconolactone hydrolase [Olea europaea subsp. europaea]|uniref:4-sulfomuconolactone hydrolase n=2 Tax=Olea europaea subsp. europaea TaxID=158383 RepID=A0A8S0SUZ9_OLEEU|nr:4-sulfomuconolactone hydrolase [Olea europaea subsp. europaea]
MMALIARLPLVLQLSCPFRHHFKKRQWAAISNSKRHSGILGFSKAEMAADSDPSKVIDSHLHVWASPQEAAENYPYFPGQEPSLPGHVGYLLECMEEAGVDGALIVQPINHKFDHSYVTSVLKKHPYKFVGCCLANPAEDGSGIKQLENLILKDGYCAVRFNPYLWPPGQPMTNEVGKAMFSKAGELGAPVGIMCAKGLNMHPEIEQLCEEFPSAVVLLDHVAFCKPPTNDEEQQVFNELLKLSRFPQVYVKFSALFRVSRKPYPYEDLSDLLSKIVSSYGANRVMWGSDFPYVVPECGYKEAKEAVCQLAQQVNLSSSELEWIMGKTVEQIFNKRW